ncbi:MAG TPA: rhomboid family intramembrane serine protease [Pyrinomonadaceae bacterium]|nr:rhomboid family intramembrane serine protease [Pyrinomonadaceae bacterium]
MIANLFVFLLMWQSSGLNNQVLLGEFSDPVLLAYGAKLNALINAPYHQWWRFVTPMFVHVNLIHIAVNMYSLWILGPYVEKIYGSAKFVVFWVLTGIAGVVASYLTVRPNWAGSGLGRFLFKAGDPVSAGASGALFGLVGVLFVFGIKFRHELPEGFKRAFGTGLIPVIMINLFIGFLGRSFIDNAAHLGGMLSGAALALVVDYRRPGDSHGSATVWRVLQIAALLLVVLCFWKASRNFSTPSVVQISVTPRDVFLNYVNVMNQAQDTVAAMVTESDTGSVDPTVKALQTVAAPDAQADELRKRLILLLVKSTTQAVSSPSPSVGPRRGPKLDAAILKELEAWKSDYNAWHKSKEQSFSH